MEDGLTLSTEAMPSLARVCRMIVRALARDTHFYPLLSCESEVAYVAKILRAEFVADQPLHSPPPPPQKNNGQAFEGLPVAE